MASEQIGRGAFLDQLLEAPLQATVALAEMTHVAVRIGENLQPRCARGPRCTCRSAYTPGYHRTPAAASPSRPAPAPPAARPASQRPASPSHHPPPAEPSRAADSRSAPRPRPPAARSSGNGSAVPGTVGTTRPAGRQAARCHLVAHRSRRRQHVRRRPDEHQPRRRALPRKGRALGEEAVAGMDGLGTGRLGRGQGRWCYGGNSPVAGAGPIL